MTRPIPRQALRLAELAEGVFACGQIMDDDLDELARFGIRSIVNNRPDGEAPGQPKSADLAAAAAARGLAYAHVPVTGGRITPRDIEQFNAVRATFEQPMLMFCASGARSAALWQQSLQDD